VVGQKNVGLSFVKKMNNLSSTERTRLFGFFNKQKRPISLAEPPKFGQAAGGGALWYFGMKLAKNVFYIFLHSGNNLCTK
jgi:hypothetical protein